MYVFVRRPEFGLIFLFVSDSKGDVAVRRVSLRSSGVYRITVANKATEPNEADEARCLPVPGNQPHDVQGLCWAAARSPNSLLCVSTEDLIHQRFQSEPISSRRVRRPTFRCHPSPGTYTALSSGCLFNSRRQCRRRRVVRQRE